MRISGACIAFLTDRPVTQSRAFRSDRGDPNVFGHGVQYNPPRRWSSINDTLEL
jgi:hypothetical protein